MALGQKLAKVFEYLNQAIDDDNRNDVLDLKSSPRIDHPTTGYTRHRGRDSFFEDAEEP